MSFVTLSGFEPSMKDVEVLHSGHRDGSGGESAGRVT